jgi:hypothetical protein
MKLGIVYRMSRRLHGQWGQSPSCKVYRVWESLKLRGLDIDHDVCKSGVMFTILVRLTKVGFTGGEGA